MEIIIELMEAYADHMRLPFLLIDVNSNIEYCVDNRKILENINNLEAHLIEMKNITTYLTKPTIMSISDKDFSSSPYYIITPHFSVNTSNFFLAAGPYWVKNDKDTSSEVNFIDEQGITTRLKKIQTLFILLANKEKEEKQITFPNQFLNRVKTIIKCDPDLSFQQYAMNTFEELVKLDDIDFLGMALKDSDDVFTIHSVKGSQVDSLAQKRFFPGEGLLGRTAILGYELFWSESNDYQGADFFYRYGVFPKHVFVYPLKKDDVVEGILFAGNFVKHKYNERLLGLLNIVVEHINQKRITEKKLLDANVISKGFEQLADLTNLLEHTKNVHVIEKKLIELFDGLNYRALIYTVSYQKEIIRRGTFTSDVTTVHELARQRRKGRIYWHEEQFIHIDLNNFGFYTLEFNEKIVNYQRMYTIFSLLEKVMATGLQQKQQESIFDLLHDSIEGLNLAQYKTSVQALKIVEQWLLQQKLPYERYQVLYNLCRVLPYSFDFLKKKISQTDEWKILMEAKQIINHQLEISQMSLEGKMIAFIHNKLIRKVDDFSFLSVNLYEQFINTYNNCFIEEIFQERTEVDGFKPVITNLPLTAREKEIIPLIIEGLNNKQVAEQLKISIHTVKNHVTNIFKKLNVTDRIQLMAMVVRIQNNVGNEEIK